MGERANLTAELSRPRLRAVRNVPVDTAEIGGLSTFTIEDFLAMPVTQQGAPVVVAGKQHLDRRVRWLHVIELVDTQGLLQGGELILATGIAFPQAPDEIAQYVDALADQGIAGLAIELGRRFATVPPAMVRACNRRHVPLIAFHREVPFVKVTEAAHSVILMGQRRLLQVTAAAHERFTELTSAEAPMEDIVTVAAELAGGQVVFANLVHQVLALCEPAGATEELLNRWDRKAFTLTKAFGTQVDHADHAVVTPVEVRGRQRGRLVLFSTGPPDRAQVTVIERAAVALGMLLLLQDDDVVVANAHRTVLESIISGRSGGVEAMHARAAALGRPTRGRYYLPVVVVSAGRDLRWVVNRALDEARIDGLAAQIGTDRWGALLLLKTDQFEQAVAAFASCVLELCRGVGIDRPVVARGGLVSALADVRHSFAEAVDVALASRVAGTPRNRKDVYAIEDVKLRGLLYTLRNDARLQAFVERMLGPLLHRDTLDGGGDWVRTLGVYLRFQGNKSLTAQELGVSRPTLYERLGRIQRLLRVDLDDPEWSTSLYAAIMVVEATAVDSSTFLQKQGESL